MRFDISANPDGTGARFLQFSKSDQEDYGKHIPLTADTLKALHEWKEQAKKAHLNEWAKRDISGHSARIGHAHNLLKEGKSLLQIMVAGGWKSTDVVLRYIENSNLITHSQ